RAREAEHRGVEGPHPGAARTGDVAGRGLDPGQERPDDHQRGRGHQAAPTGDPGADAGRGGGGGHAPTLTPPVTGGTDPHAVGRTSGRSAATSGCAPPPLGARGLPLGANRDRRHRTCLTRSPRACFPPRTPDATRVRPAMPPSRKEGTFMDERQRREYWRRNLRLMAILLTIWAAVSFGAGIWFVEPLNNIVIADFPLGFWFAQHGSILTFLALIAVYVWRMDKLDKEYGVDELEEE